MEIIDLEINLKMMITFSYIYQYTIKIYEFFYRRTKYKTLHLEQKLLFAISIQVKSCVEKFIGGELKMSGRELSS